MNYSVEQRKKVVAGIFIFMVLTFFGCYRLYYLVPGIVEHAGSCIMYPFLKLQQYCVQPIQRYYASRKTIEALRRRISELEAMYEAVQAEAIALKASRAFMHDIEELVTFKKRYDTSYMRIAQIMVKHREPSAHFMYVDAGALSGVTVDMIALYKNMLVGRVIETYPWYSKVQLITDPSCRVSVSCAYAKVRGIYCGIGLCEIGDLTRVNHLDTVSIGEEIFSSGEGLLFPKGYLVGTVSSCKSQGLYHSLHVTPAVDIDSINYCVLISQSSL